MDSLKVSKFVVVRIHTNTKEEPSISPIHDFVIAELSSFQSISCKRQHDWYQTHFDKVGLVFLIPGCYKTMDIAPKSDLLSNELLQTAC